MIRAIIAITVFAAASAANAQDRNTYFYNNYGQPQGHASTSGSSTYLYNNYGQPMGSFRR